jgi:hypothetical protein
MQKLCIIIIIILLTNQTPLTQGANARNIIKPP